MAQSQPLEYYLQGNEQSKDIVVFVQGWPDNHQVWSALDVQNTLKDNQCLFINFPNTSKTQNEVAWGQDFPVIVQRMRATFEKIKLDQFQKKVIVCHDWGCFYTYLFDKTFPNTFDEIISLDVAAWVEVRSITAKLMVLAYQWTLAVAFLLNGKIGKFLCQGVSKFFKYRPPHFDELTGARCYPYFYLWRNMLSSIFNKRKLFLYGYKPSVPVVFLYGKKKPFQFSSRKWENYLLEHERCEIHGVESGHWIMKEATDFLRNLIVRRLKDLKR